MGFVAPPAAILPALRAGTGLAHEQLEAAVDIAGCIAHLPRYRQLLEAFFGFYRPLEEGMFALPAWDSCALDLTQRRKTPWLETDLLALGAAGPLPDCLDLPPARTLSESFGCLYVLEGATLGGRQISALLHGSRVPENARTFFGSYGPATGERWQEFLVALERHAAQAGDQERDALVGSARQTFACLQAWVHERAPRL